VPGKGKPPPSHLQLVEPRPRRLDMDPISKARVMAERDRTALAFRQLGAPIFYCELGSDAPLDPDDSESLIDADPHLEEWRINEEQQGVNAAIQLVQGVVELIFFGPDQAFNQCFMAAAAHLQLSTRYAIGRLSKDAPSSILFKLRLDEALRVADEYSMFMPRPFVIDGGRRGVVLKLTSSHPRAKPAIALLPGSLLWHANGQDHELFIWTEKAQPTAAPLIEFFHIVRAYAYAAVLNLIGAKDWASEFTRRLICEWLARVVRDGAAINANVAFSKAARAVLATPQHAEELLALLCQQRGGAADHCVEQFKFAKKRLEDDPTRKDIAGWAAIGRVLSVEAEKALRAVLNVGADAAILEDLAERYLYHESENAFIDCNAFHEGAANYVFASDALRLRHAPDLVVTKKKPIEAWPVFVRSQLRRSVHQVDMYPDRRPGEILRVTRESQIVADDDYAPERSRLVFNDWRGLYIEPAKTVETALKAECADKLSAMLSLVCNRHEGRMQWIRRHIGWTLKHPGKKQQIALVATGDQGTGKSFLCTNFAEAVFGRYAATASVRALDGQFYVPSYVGKLWVSHDEFVSNAENGEIIKGLIRSTHISGQFKGQDVTTHTSFARLAFTSNETNPGISRDREDRGLFQVTSISAASEGLLPIEFQDRMRREVAPFYEAFAEFLKRDDVRRAYVRMLIDEAPDKISEVEDMTFSATRDEAVARAHLTPTQQVAKYILELGTIWGGWDIATPFNERQLLKQAHTVARDLGFRDHEVKGVFDEYLNARIIERSPSGSHAFKFKIGQLQKLFGEYLNVPLYAQWKLEPLDFIHNEWHGPEDYVEWKGRR
jgi:hypothetical protein